MSESEMRIRIPAPRLSFFPKHSGQLWKSLVPGTRFAQETRTSGLSLSFTYARNSPSKATVRRLRHPQVEGVRVPLVA